MDGVDPQGRRVKSARGPGEAVDAGSSPNGASARVAREVVD